MPMHHQALGFFFNFQLHLYAEILKFNFSIFPFNSIHYNNLSGNKRIINRILKIIRKIIQNLINLLRSGRKIILKE